MSGATQLLALGAASGTSASGAISATTTSTAFVAATAEYTVKPGAAGTVTLTGTAHFDVTAGSVGHTIGYGKWQWKISGGSYADVSGEISAASVYWDGSTSDGAADAQVDDVKTGLTPGLDYVFKLMVRQNTAVRTGAWTGTAQAVGS